MIVVIEVVYFISKRVNVLKVISNIYIYSSWDLVSVFKIQSAN